MKKIIYFLAGAILMVSCNNNKTLPILGNRYAETKVVNGQTLVDTVYQQIPEFSLINQDSVTVTNKTVLGKVYVADFFFTSCPTICPVMKKEMIRVYEKYKGNQDIMILSHTIDPDYDTLPVLRDYANRLGADGRQWMFLTGNRPYIYDLAEKGYYASAKADSTEPGGFVHSGGFILVDRQQRVRGIYDGTSTADVNRLMDDMDVLLKEKE